MTLGKPVTYRVDTGAEVTVMPDRLFKKNSPLIKKTKQNCLVQDKMNFKRREYFMQLSQLRKRHEIKIYMWSPT